jgi:hypothetical protein
MHLKSLSATALLLGCATLCPAQEYMDSLAKASCECLGKIPEGVPAQELNARAGICLLQQLPPYKDKLKTDFGVDLDNIVKDGERIGQILGLRMATQCPTTVVKLGIISKADKAAVVENTVEGVISRIEKDFFVVFSLKDNSDKTIKLYWLSQVPSSIDLINNYESLLGKSIKVTYQPKEFFDPKVNDYRPFNLITKIW